MGYGRSCFSSGVLAMNGKIKAIGVVLGRSPCTVFGIRWVVVFLSFGLLAALAA